MERSSDHDKPGPAAMREELWNQGGVTGLERHCGRAVVAVTSHQWVMVVTPGMSGSLYSGNESRFHI
jgi:hypothetical protein